MIGTRLLNALWMARATPERRALERSTRRVAQTQAALLATIVAANRDTEFGRRHDFARLGSPADFQRHVPLSVYDDYRPAIASIAAGDSRVLTREPTLLLEPTSGTTGGEKWIPYTASLRRQFQRGIAAWIADMFRQRPAVRRGRAYWSISPAAEPRTTAAGIPIGFADDAAYLALAERLAARRLLAVPSSVARLGDVATTQYGTLLSLLRCDDLALISVWSPTFLRQLLSRLQEWHEPLTRDLRTGGVQPPWPVSAATQSRLASQGAAASARADLLASLLRAGAGLAEQTRILWPNLALISCWCDAAAARYVDPLRELFPGVELQPKGLLATEGFVSLPLLDAQAPLLAIRSHFFEFLDISAFDRDSRGARCRLAHELDVGGDYEIVLTTGGGLYRYRLGDGVRIVGHRGQAPLLRFLGKCDSTSDLVGEKLAEPFVRALLDRIFAKLGLQPRFALLAPFDAGGRPSYRLYCQDDISAKRPDLRATILQQLSDGLRANPHYAYARDLGQLGPETIQVAATDGPSLWTAFERRCLDAGQTLGDIKPTALDRRDGWETWFDP